MDNSAEKGKPAPKPKAAETPDPAMVRFFEFWEAWPPNSRKHDKAKCAQHWARHNLDAVAEQIFGDVRAKRGSSKWTKEDGEFIEAPLTYLRGRRWEDQTGSFNGKPWHETALGIEDKGVELGIGRWDRKLWESGDKTGEQWPTYVRRVYKVAGFTPTNP